MCAVIAGCDGTTGFERLTFSASAAGPADAPGGGTLEFDNAVGYHVTLTKAVVHVGALYLNEAVPSSGSQASACILPGIYVGQVLGSLDVDTLDPTPQPFPITGDGTATPAFTAEVWLTGGDINAADDGTLILDAAGTATDGSDSFPFAAQITIGKNRLKPVQNPAEPGANPICKERIVTPIAVDFTLSQGSKLLLRIDPRQIFEVVDFSSVPNTPALDPPYQFANKATDPADISLYNGLHSGTTVYQFSVQ